MFSIKSLNLRPICLNFIKTMKNNESKGILLSMKSSQISVKLLSTRKKYKKKFDFDLPPLMKFQPKLMPNILYLLKNEFIIDFFQKPLIDPEFSTKNFLSGAKQALAIISGNLANDNIEGIKQLVTEEAFAEISETFKKFTEKQKQLLRVNVEDILLYFLYNIEIQRIAPDSIIVKIFTVFNVVPEIHEILRMEFNNAFNNDFEFFDFKKYFDLIVEQTVSCNYEFIRHFIKGSQSEWSVSKLNHFKYKDLLRMYGMVGR